MQCPRMRKGFSPTHLDSCEVFKTGDGGSSDMAVMRKAKRKGGGAEVWNIEGFASFDSICSRRCTK